VAMTSSLRGRIGLPTVCLAVLSSVLFGATALAMGAGGGAGMGRNGGETNGAPQPDASDGRSDLTSCPKGYVWDAKNRSCAAVRNSVQSDSD
jgi:hypothetical protein